MGYDVHITRKANWADDHGPVIRREEWLTYVAGAADIVMPEQSIAGGSYDQAMLQLPDGSQWPIWYINEDIRTKGPSDAVIIALYPHAQALRARLMGDEGEVYGPDARVIKPENTAAARTGGWRGLLNRLFGT